MTDTERYEQILREFAPTGTPDKDHIQTVLTEKFIAWLKFEAPETKGMELFLSADMITQKFAERWVAQLEYIGTYRQDAILLEAMSQTGGDLSHWLEEE